MTAGKSGISTTPGRVLRTRRVISPPAQSVTVDGSPTPYLRAANVKFGQFELGAAPLIRKLAKNLSVYLIHCA